MNSKLKVDACEHYEGEWVLLLDHERLVRLNDKFAPYWKEPYVILKLVSKIRVLLGKQDLEVRRGRKPYLIVHVN